MKSLSDMKVGRTPRTPSTAEIIGLADRTLAESNRLLSSHAPHAQKDHTTMTLDTAEGPSLAAAARDLHARNPHMTLEECQTEVFLAAERAASKTDPRGMGGPAPGMSDDGGDGTGLTVTKLAALLQAQLGLSVEESQRRAYAAFAMHAV